MKNVLKDGVYDGLSFEEYHNDSAIGSSTLKTIITKSPGHAKIMSSINKNVADFGTSIHCAILEPEKFEKTILRGPDNRRGNDWKDKAHEAELNGQILLTSGDYDEVLFARDAVLKNNFVKTLLSNKLAAERSLFWTDKVTGLRCKARPDLMTTDNYIVDIKTTRSAHPDNFMRDVYTYRYHMQEAHYVDAVFATQNDKFYMPKFLFLCIEKIRSYPCAIYSLDPATVKEGLNLRNKALEICKECTENNKWPFYYEGIKELRIPAYGFETIDLEEFDEEILP